MVVDDEAAQRRLVEQVLTGDGYEVLQAQNGQESLCILFEEKPDLVLLDVMMPELDGWQTCSCIREITDIPIIMLTGKKTSEDDIVRGMECGADEYLAKPVGNRELIARVHSVLRRAEQPYCLDKKQRTTYSDAYLAIDVEERKVEVEGSRLRLTPREFRLLALLIENADRVLTHQQVLENVWGWEYIDDVDYVRIYISHLRQKIEPNPAQPVYILTEPGVSYSFHKNN